MCPCGEEWVFSSVGERFLHTEEVEGSKPPTPTIAIPSRRNGGISFAALAQLAEQLICNQ